MNHDAMQKLIDVIHSLAEPMQIKDNNYDSLLRKIGDARFVLIGEASHGTHEFYQIRVEISQALIKQKGFMAIAIEGDWPNAYRIHRYLQGQGEVITGCNEALEGFNQFPIWMWRNTVIREFLQSLRKYNDQITMPNQKIGFYGLDLYSLHASIQAVISYLEKIDPVAAERAKGRYACFDHTSRDPQTYGYLASKGIKKACIEEAVEELLELQHHAFEYIHKDGLEAAEEFFYTTQNARLVRNAERYYRSMFEGHVSSWNVRDRHMAETLNVLADHLENRFQRPAKIIVWAHNSHVGDARATEMGSQGEVNIGQLIREQHEAVTYNIGFSTYQGYVTAASDWGMPAEHKTINPGLYGSYEELFHQIKYPNFLLELKNNPELEHYLKIPRLQRAIGVVYRPDTELQSHYFFTRLPYQFDSIIHIDNTTAVQPL